MYDQDKLLLGQASDSILYAPEEAHLMTIGYTGSGKGVSSLLPNLLNYQGSVVCVDIKGEAARLTAGYRQSMGQNVWVVDPFNAAGLNDTKAINPFAAMAVSKPEIPVEYARALARAILPNQNSRDPFWDEKARQMLACLILFVRYRDLKAEVGIDDVRYYLNRLARTPDVVRQEILKSKFRDIVNTANALDAEPRVLRSIISTAESALDNLVGRAALKSLSSINSIDYQQVVEGSAFTIYLVIPPHLLASSSSLLRIWLVTLFQAMYSRTRLPDLETLFLIDEAAQLGPLEELRQAITLMRGYGVRTWTFWQDLSQLKRLYLDDWPSLVNNCLALQVFGAHTGMAKHELVEVLGGFSYRELEELPLEEQVLLLCGQPSISKKLSYLACDQLLHRSQTEWKFHDNGLHLVEWSLK